MSTTFHESPTAKAATDVRELMTKQVEALERIEAATKSIEASVTAFFRIVTIVFVLGCGWVLLAIASTF